MTFDEYQVKAARTIASDKNYEQEMHAIHGMVAETGEIVEALQSTDELCRRVGSECGDLYWMIAEYCTSQGWSMSEIDHMRTTIESKGILVYDLVIWVAKLHGMYQKMYQGHNMMELDYKQTVCNILFVLNEFTRRFCLSVDECLEMNIKKLLARYPNGFETERSIHRAQGDI